MRSPHLAPRAGVTLLEVVVALFLLQLALLGLAAAGAATLRGATDAMARGRAATLAANRLEQLRAARCAAAGGTARHAGGIEEHWTVSGGAVQVIADSVSWPARRGRGALRVEARVAC